MTNLLPPLRALRYLALVLPVISSVVQAADPSKHVDLVCDVEANLALVRFSDSGDAPPAYPRLPQRLDSGLSASSGTDRTDCTLANGTTIRVRGGVEQAFAYGLGGGNPPAFFSMWVNKRKVFSRRVWMPGYAESFDNPSVYDGVLLSENRITICATAEGSPQECSSRPLNLAKVPVDDLEYASSRRKLPIGHVSIVAKGTKNQRFCESYLRLLKPGIESALNGETTSLDVDVASLTKPVFEGDERTRFGLIELLPGIRHRLMIWRGESHYFDGVVIALGPADMARAKITAAFPFENIDVWPKSAPLPGITLISGGQKQLYPEVSPRYVHLVPQRIGTALYILAYPTNQKVRPTAALVKPLAKGGFATMCSFHRNEPNY